MYRRAVDFTKTRTGQLALTYLGIIMALTLVFSLVIYGVSSRQFDRPLPERAMMMRSIDAANSTLQQEFDQRATDAKGDLLINLLLLNLVVLSIGAWFSVFLAKRTMAPIEEAMDEQARFIGDASHELRTPLTALRTSNEVALRRGKITDSEARELAGRNVQEIDKLHSLTVSLLGLVQAGQAGPQLAPVDLQAAVSDAMEPVVVAAQANRITVQDEVPAITVQSSYDQLVQVIRILLDNAVKYSDPKGTVRIAAKVADNSVELQVIDTGIGIDKADLPAVFDRFYRADQSRTKGKREGYGLGLSIAKSLSDQLGMDIHAKSKPGKGSTFTITLPIHIA